MFCLPLFNEYNIVIVLRSALRRSYLLSLICLLIVNLESFDLSYF